VIRISRARGLRKKRQRLSNDAVVVRDTIMPVFQHQFQTLCSAVNADVVTVVQQTRQSHRSKSKR
jgi:hypothetical protein